MSAIQWAKTIRCDWPGCQSEGEVILNPRWPDREIPAGWADLGMAYTRMTDVRGPTVREFCSIHSSFTVAQLCDMLNAKEATSDDRT